MIWQDDFTGGIMKLVTKAADGLRLLDGYALKFTGKSTAYAGVTDAWIGAVSNVIGNFTIEVGVIPNKVNDADSPYQYAGISGENYVIFPAQGYWNWGNSKEGHAGAGISIGTNRLESFEHDINYLPVLTGYTGNFNSFSPVSLVYDGNIPSIYLLDSLLNTYGAKSPKIVHPSATISSGYRYNNTSSWNWGSYGPFNGTVYYLYIYDHPRTPSQLKADAYRIPKPDEPGLLLAFLFDEGQGQILNDWSSHALNGVVSDPSTGVSWVAGRKRAGARLVTLNISSNLYPSESSISWIANTPSGTSISIETNLSLDGGITWQGWAVCTNGGPIPGISIGVDLSNARLKIWEHLSTADPLVEPVLTSLSVNINTNYYKDFDTEVRMFVPSSDFDTKIMTFAKKEFDTGQILVKIGFREFDTSLVLYSSRRNFQPLPEELMLPVIPTVRMDSMVAMWATSLQQILSRYLRNMAKAINNMLAGGALHVDTLPTPDGTYWNRIVVVSGDATNPDHVYICLKMADGTFAWVKIV